jgi:hypothetical protein
MALPAHPAAVYAHSSSGAYSGHEIGNIDKCNYSPSVDLLDVTDFKDTSGAKKKLAALTDGKVTLDGWVDMSDTAQNLLRSSMATGASVWVTWIFNPTGSTGSKGFQVECKVKSFTISGDTPGAIVFTCELEFNGAPAADS